MKYFILCKNTAHLLRAKVQGCFAGFPEKRCPSQVRLPVKVVWTYLVRLYMTERNKYGLSRTVSAGIRREVRRRCGFGCVRCGLGLYDYEHFDPDFKDATEHRAEGITLLCMQCNQKRRRGVLSVESVRAANVSPRCLEQGFASEAFDFGQGPIEIVFAGVTFADCDRLIEVNGFPILSIKPPEAPSQPYQLSGRFADDTGDITLKIEDNVWSAGADNWDVECIGPRITIRNGLRDIALTLKAEPPTRLIVEKLNMQFEGILLRGSGDQLEISFDGKHWSQFTGCNMRGCAVGISLSNRRV